MPPGFDQFPGLIVPIALPHHSDDSGDEKAANNSSNHLPTDKRPVARNRWNVRLLARVNREFLARHCLKIRWKVLVAQYSRSKKILSGSCDYLDPKIALLGLSTLQHEPVGPSIPGMNGETCSPFCELRA